MVYHNFTLKILICHPINYHELLAIASEVNNPSRVTTIPPCWDSLEH